MPDDIDKQDKICFIWIITRLYQLTICSTTMDDLGEPGEENVHGSGVLEVKDTRWRPVLIKHRSRRHLLPIIQKNVRTGSQVLSDCWSEYSTTPYIHYQENHRRSSVHPHPAHIQKIYIVTGKPHQTFITRKSTGLGRIRRLPIGHLIHDIKKYIHLN